ncbi:MAG TPA: hypothetical protein VFR24_03090 [Candidatus Angelobacter sp.]|nr:hypothetical protein [Candidatus Angelobacter sp.]
MEYQEFCFFVVFVLVSIFDRRLNADILQTSSFRTSFLKQGEAGLRAEPAAQALTNQIGGNAVERFGA